MAEEIVNADLHIHSALSPCADLDMNPQQILQRAFEKGLNLISITDHNSILNLQSFIEAAREFKSGKIKVIPGIEVQCLEEVHIICLFETVYVASKFYKYIEDYLPDVKNKISVFGEQLVLDSKGSIIAREERLLLNSLRLDVENVVNKARECGGLSIAAHLDRPAYSLLYLLGFIPKALRLDALEVSYRVNPKIFMCNAGLTEYSTISSSDAHYLSDIGRAYISFKGEPSFMSLQRALLDNKFSIIKGGVEA